MFGLKLNKYEYFFQSVEGGGRGSGKVIQLQVSENVNYLI